MTFELLRWLATAVLLLLIIWLMVSYVFISVMQRVLVSLQTQMSPGKWYTYDECVQMYKADVLVGVALRILHEEKRLLIRVDTDRATKEYGSKLANSLERDVSRNHFPFLGQDVFQFQYLPGGGRKRIKVSPRFFLGSLKPQPVVPA